MPTELRTSPPAAAATTRHRRLIAMLFTLFAVGYGGIATAQRPGGSQYRPARPTLSPYMGLLQTNTGPIPNYFSLVRPMLQQQAFNRQIQATTRTQSLQIQTLSGQGVQQQSATQTGKSAGFQRYLHYYPAPTASGRR